MLLRPTSTFDIKILTDTKVSQECFKRFCFVVLSLEFSLVCDNLTCVHQVDIFDSSRRTGDIRYQQYLSGAQ